MKRLAILAFLPVVLIGCGGPAEDGGGQAEAPKSGIQLDVTPPAALDVPEPVEVSSDTDWEAKAHNKNIEVVQVINIINPVAAMSSAHASLSAVSTGTDAYGMGGPDTIVPSAPTQSTW